MDGENAHQRSVSDRQDSAAGAADREFRTAVVLDTRREGDTSLPERIRSVGEAGFDGVEFTGGLDAADADAVSTALADADVEPVATQVDRADLLGDLDGVVERVTAVGCRRLVVAGVGVEHLVTDRAVRDVADELARLGARLRDRGVELCYRNRRRDLRPQFGDSGVGAVLGLGPVAGLVGDRATAALDAATPSNSERVRAETALGQLIARTTGRSLGFEIDTGAVAAAGYDPVQVLALAGDRVTAVGLSPAVDTEAVIRAAHYSDVEWVVPGADTETALQRGVDPVAP